MKVTLLAFASAAQRLGWRTREVAAEAGLTPLELFQTAHPDFSPGVARVAVNGNYHDWNSPIGPDAREVAIIPPVSGG
jgi:molybdopterin converting factor small subunit